MKTMSGPIVCLVLVDRTPRSNLADQGCVGFLWHSLARASPESRDVGPGAIHPHEIISKLSKTSDMFDW
jgi:hypothetical protein